VPVPYLGVCGINMYAEVLETFLLALAGVELILFIVACVVLYVRSVMKTALVTPLCFSSCCTVLVQCQGLFCFSCRPASE